jgi:hypothetical protein
MSEAAMKAMTQVWIYVPGTYILEFKHRKFLKPVCKFKVSDISDQHILGTTCKEVLESNFRRFSHSGVKFEASTECHFYL